MVITPGFSINTTFTRQLFKVYLNSNWIRPNVSFLPSSLHHSHPALMSHHDASRPHMTRQTSYCDIKPMTAQIFSTALRLPKSSSVFICPKQNVWKNDNRLSAACMSRVWKGSVCCLIWMDFQSDSDVYMYSNGPVAVRPFLMSCEGTDGWYWLSCNKDPPGLLHSGTKVRSRVPSITGNLNEILKLI